MYRESEKFKQEIQAAKDAPKNIQKAKSELDSLSCLLNNSDEGKFQEMILQKIAVYQENSDIVLKELPARHYYQENDFIVETNKIVLEGSFHSLIAIIHEMEKDFLFSKMAGISFETYKDNKKRKTKLQVAIYYQNIKTFNNEN